MLIILRLLTLLSNNINRPELVQEIILRIFVVGTEAIFSGCVKDLTNGCTRLLRYSPNTEIPNTLLEPLDQDQTP